MIRVLFLLIFCLFALLSGNERPALAESAEDYARSLQENPLYSRISGQNCGIWDDPQGIPHAHAPDELTAMACLGFLHGRDRPWQMDYFRKRMKGTLSEWGGASFIESDFIFRLLGLPERASALFEKLKPEYQRKLQAYSYGVNRAFSESAFQNGYEFKKFGGRPEAWTPADSISLILMKSLAETVENYEYQMEEEGWKKFYGQKAKTLFEKEGEPWNVAILKAGEFPKKSSEDREGEPTQTRAESAHEKPQENLREDSRDGSNEESPEARLSPDFKKLMPELFPPSGDGSNSWVVAPEKSASSHAWLANDPHLELSHPPHFYWLHISGGALEAMGATLPGVPFIFSGTNLHVSWGLTNSNMVTSELQAVSKEELDEPEHSTTSLPVIWFKAWFMKLPFFFKTFQRTAQGWPVLPLEAPPGKALVLKWTGYDLTANDLNGFFEVMVSKSASEADHAFSKIGVSSWNFVFADDQGHIGFRTVGRVARIESPPEMGLQEKHFSDLGTEAFPEILSPAEMPHLSNPERGFIVTANNIQWPKDAKYYPGRSHDEGFRAFRIEEEIRAEPKHDLASLQAVQCDDQAVDARFLLPRMLPLLSTEELDIAKQATEALFKWNYRAEVGCEACGIYRRWVTRLMAERNINEVALYRELSAPDPDSSLERSVRESYLLALDDLEIHPYSKLPIWKDLHQSSFEHQMGSDFFRAQAFGTPGDNFSVNLGASRWQGGKFIHYDGASHRLIVEMSQPPKIYSALAGSNLDISRRDLSDPQGSWQKWNRCELEKRNFPVNWASIEDLVFDVKL